MHRRAFLTGVAGTATLAIAGCMDGSEEEPPEEALRFFVTNEDDVQRSITIEIRAEGSSSGASGTLLPADEQNDPFQYTYPGEGVAVEATVESDNASRSLNWDPSECTELHVNTRIVEGVPELTEECQ